LFEIESPEPAKPLLVTYGSCLTNPPFATLTRTALSESHSAASSEFLEQRAAARALQRAEAEAEAEEEQRVRAASRAHAAQLHRAAATAAQRAHHVVASVTRSAQRDAPAPAAPGAETKSDIKAAAEQEIQTLESQVLPQEQAAEAAFRDKIATLESQREQLKHGFNFAAIAEIDRLIAQTRAAEIAREAKVKEVLKTDIHAIEAAAEQKEVAREAAVVDAAHAGERQIADAVALRAQDQQDFVAKMAVERKAQAALIAAHTSKMSTLRAQLAAAHQRLGAAEAEEVKASAGVAQVEKLAVAANQAFVAEEVEAAKANARVVHDLQ
jgi:hypothetical protein